MIIFEKYQWWVVIILTDKNYENYCTGGQKINTLAGRIIFMELQFNQKGFVGLLVRLNKWITKETWAQF